jgi:hypothetical protein
MNVSSVRYEKYEAVLLRRPYFFLHHAPAGYGLIYKMLEEGNKGGKQELMGFMRLSVFFSAYFFLKSI